MADTEVKHRKVTRSSKNKSKGKEVLDPAVDPRDEVSLIVTMFLYSFRQNTAKKNSFNSRGSHDRLIKPFFI